VKNHAGADFVVHDAPRQHMLGASCIRKRFMAAASKKTVRTSVILPESAHARIQALADTNNVSAAWVIRAAIMQFLEEHDDETQLPLKLPKMKKGAG
jgi:hypothetical protein